MRTTTAGLPALAFLIVLVGGCPQYVDYVGTEDDGSGTPGDDDAEGDDDSLDPFDDDDRQEDEFVQDAAGAVDVLFVVDNSCSMQEEQAALQGNFWSFIQYFVDSGVDYHIGITVLDDWPGQPSIGELYGSVRYIDNTTPDPVGAFIGNMTIGDQGMGACELGLEASYRTLTEPLLSGYNGGFYREEEFLLTEDPTYQVPYSYVYDAVSNAIVFSVDTVPAEGGVIRALYEIQV